MHILQQVGLLLDTDVVAIVIVVQLLLLLTLQLFANNL